MIEIFLEIMLASNKLQIILNFHFYKFLCINQNFIIDLLNKFINYCHLQIFKSENIIKNSLLRPKFVIINKIKY